MQKFHTCCSSYSPVLSSSALPTPTFLLAHHYDGLPPPIGMCVSWEKAAKLLGTIVTLMIHNDQRFHVNLLASFTDLS